MEMVSGLRFQGSDTNVNRSPNLKQRLRIGGTYSGDDGREVLGIEHINLGGHEEVSGAMTKI
jgi:hypothetical protein